MSNQKEEIRDICNQVVDAMFVERNPGVEKSPRIGMFTISGKAKDTKVVAHWISTVTAGMPIATACAVIATNPILMQNIRNIFPDVVITFNIPGIRDTVNDLKEE